MKTWSRTFQCYRISLQEWQMHAHILWIKIHIMKSSSRKCEYEELVLEDRHCCVCDGQNREPKAFKKEWHSCMTDKPLLTRSRQRERERRTEKEWAWNERDRVAEERKRHQAQETKSMSTAISRPSQSLSLWHKSAHEMVWQTLFSNRNKKSGWDIDLECSH